jgi:branched-chain amino acid aminotransferase
MAKTAGNYINSQLVVVEAKNHGYAEGIVLDTVGYVSEGSGENIFLVRDGEIFTPSLGSSILPGITRRYAIQLARDLDLPITRGRIPREMLYLADEVFFTGTAAEITPVRSVDHRQVGDGKRGPITEKIQTAYFDIIEGRAEDRHGWLTQVYDR